MSGAKLFEPGREKTGGRKKGSRNKLSGDFVAALSEAFDQHGKDAITIVAKENPEQFLKVIASILPKEFEINDNRLKDFSDDELDFLIELAKRNLGARRADGGEEQTLN
jgi:hypothetical protein